MLAVVLWGAVVLCPSASTAQPEPRESWGHESGPASPARPSISAPPPAAPFDSGSMELGLALGLSAGDGTAFSLGAAFGYFVLPGLEPGLQLEVSFGSDRPTVTTVLPYLRWVVWRSYALSPFLKVQGGRWFVSGGDDISALGGGGGVVLFVGRGVGLQLEGLVYRLFPCQDSCVTESVGLSLGFYFGGSGRRPPPSPPPPQGTAAGAPVGEAPAGDPGRDEPVPW